MSAWPWTTGSDLERVAVVVPAYNEARLIAQTIRSIPSYVTHVVVVDDASTDATAQIVQRLEDPRVDLIRHRENRGVGAAIVTGYQRAFACGADACAVMAGDGQMDPRDLAPLLSPVLGGDADYAKGNRLAFRGARRLMPLSRWLGNLILAQLTSWVTGLRVRDSQCGYTVLSRRAAELLPLGRLWQRYGYPNDLLGMVAERGLRVREIVVRPVYGNEKSGLGWRDALLVVPFVLARVGLRRVSRDLRLLRPLSPPERPG
jgi:glycosyltransferase involved in cell wall biosynthesis